MARNSCRNRRCASNRRSAEAETAAVIKDNAQGCTAVETNSEVMYNCNCIAPVPLMRDCCDPLRGCTEQNAELRCDYWPRFAHPRWLTCRELYSKNR